MQNGPQQLTTAEMLSMHPLAIASWPEPVEPKAWWLVCHDAVGAPILGADSADNYPFTWDPSGGEWDPM